MPEASKISTLDPGGVSGIEIVPVADVPPTTESWPDGFAAGAVSGITCEEGESAKSGAEEEASTEGPGAEGGVTEDDNKIGANRIVGC